MALSLLCLHLLHHGLVLHVHGRQLLPNSVVDLEELGHASVQADRLTLAEVSVMVLGWNTFFVARSRQPMEGNRNTLMSS